MLLPIRQEKNIDEIIDDNFSVWKIKTKEYQSNWKFSIVDQWQHLIWWYSDDQNLVYDGRLPVIIYWDHTNVVKFINFPFICGADWVKVFQFKDGIDVKFMKYALDWLKPDTQWYRRHYSLLKEIKIPIPPLTTQQAIVAKLDDAMQSIDKNIALLDDNFIKLIELKASLLHDAFSGKLIV